MTVLLDGGPHHGERHELIGAITTPNAYQPWGRGNPRCWYYRTGEHVGELPVYLPRRPEAASAGTPEAP